jgi:RNA methyltransferase, TrmH family
MKITSLTNPRVKDLVRLRQRSHRDEAGRMLIEGYREILRALNNRHNPHELYVCAELFQGVNEPALIEQCRQAGAEVFECSEPVFMKIAYRERPEGLLAVASQVRGTLDGLVVPPNPLLVIAEAVEKPGNLGTILRTADAAGAHAVIVCDRCTDINNPNVVRASIGTLFSLPVVETTTVEALTWLRGKGIRIVATTPHTELLHTSADLKGGVAIVLGAEQYGLSATWIEQADIKVRIPMMGQADSLNVAASATILLYEAVRQRGWTGKTIPDTGKHVRADLADD